MTAFSVVVMCIRLVLPAALLLVTTIPCSAQRHSIPPIVETAIIEQIQRDLQSNDIDIELSINDGSLARIAPKEPLIDNVILQKKASNLKGGNIKVRIEFSDNSSETIIGRYTTYVYAPVAARFLKAGIVIAPEDINLSKTKLRDIHGSISRNIAGMQTRRNISSGNIVRESDLTSPKIIHNNDIINIHYSSGGITLQTSAIALENGGKGDVINVKNQKTGVILSGTVIDNNLVEIGK